MLLYRRFCPHFSFFGLILVILTVISCIVQLSCTSYGVGGLYTSNQPTEAGVYLYADAKFAEASASYSLNLSDYDIQSLGAGISLKVPISFWEISVYPLANIEYQHVLSEAVSINNLAWFRFGAGVDFPIESPFYVRVQGMYTPDLFSSLPLPFEDSISNIIGLNDSTGYTIKLGVGWRPGASGRSTAPQPPRSTAQPQQPQPQQPRAQQQAPQAQPQARQQQPQQSNASEFEWRVLELTNIQRANHGLPPLQWDNILGATARAHTQDMVRNNFFSHVGSDQSSVGQRVTRAGFTWSKVAENIAQGQRTPEEVVNSWMNSPGHRANILDPALTHLGVGFAVNTWTQNFGTPR